MPTPRDHGPLLRCAIAALLLTLLALGAHPLAAEDEKPSVLLVADGAGDDAPDFVAADQPLDAKAIALAMKRGVTWLQRKQRDSGSWGGTRGNASYGGGAGGNADGNLAGPTALALYALLRARVPLMRPVVRRGFQYLAKRHKKPLSSMEASMLLLALTATARKQPRSKATGKSTRPKVEGRYRPWAEKTRAYLVSKRVARGWRYNHAGQQASHGGPEDLASTWLAALALFEAQRLGLKTPDAVWEDILAYARAQQDDDGPAAKYIDPTDPNKTLIAYSRGFAYIKGQEDADEGQATGGMTACGVAAITLARFVLSEGGRKQAAWDKRPDAERVQSAVFDGLAWLKREWQPFENPRKKNFNINHGFWWFALESALTLSGVRRLGEHDWHVEFAQGLVNRQAKDGHWDTKSSVAPSDTLDTCFALLLLARNTHGLIPYPSVRGGRHDPPPKAK